MVNIAHEDKKPLFDLLIRLPILKNEKGREAVLINASLEELRPHLDLEGPSAVVIPLMIQFFCSYGRLTYEHESLGRFLNTITGYVGLEEQEQLQHLIAKYGLMTPVAKSPAVIDATTIPLSTADVQEKIIGENTLRPIAFLQQGLNAARSVAYVEVKDGADQWSGTGFLIAPNVLVTNHHVLPEQKLLAQSIFRFNYQLDHRGNAEKFTDYQAKEGGIYHADQTLDYAIVELEGNPGGEWGCLSLKQQIPETDSRVNIIQHPNGLPKHISIQNNFVTFADPLKIQYVTSTLHGSSGSPVCDDEWQVVGLHHGFSWVQENEDEPGYFRNAGTTIRAILENLPDSVKEKL